MNEKNGDDGVYIDPWEGQEPYPDMGDWPADEDVKGWTEYALKSLMNELFCTLKHIEQGERVDDHSDFYDAAVHMKNVSTGVSHTAHTIFGELLNDGERITVTQHLMEKELGIPVKWVEIGGMVGFVPDPPSIPNDLSELEGQ